ncbi:MAG: PAS domain S-box protein, partial [Chloroflexi bacterium]
YDSHGAYKNAVILITDISERIQAEAALRQSEERFRTIFESAPIGMVITDAENRLIQTNQAFQQMIEYSQDELAMMTSDDITHPNDLEQNQTVRGMWQADDCNHVTVEKRYVTKSGGVLWAITSVFRLFDAHGREINSVAMITDITAHKNAEAKLRESETLYRTLTANLPKSAVMIYDHDLRFVLVDGPEIEAAGFTKAMLEGHIVHDVLPAEFVEAVEPYLQGALRGETHCVELPFGDHLIYELTYLPLREHNDHIIHGMILARNITDLREAEQQARELESAKEQERERYRALFEQSNDGIFLMGLDGHYIDCNQRAADMLGYTREEIVNMTYRDVSPPSEHPKALLIFEQLMRNETPPIYERTLLKKDGTTFPAEIRVEVVRDADHNPLHIQSVVRDITERKQHEQALRESEAKYRSMIESLAEGIIVQNADNIVIAANTSAERMLGIPGKQMINQRADVVDLHLIREDGTRIPRDQYPARVTLRTGLPQNNLIAGIVQPNKPVLWISINTRPLFNEYSDQPIAVVLSFTDITEFKKAQQERFEMTLEKERMQVLRDFINDASHDLKTPITTINTSLYLIGKQDVSEAIKRHLDVVQSQADYLTKLVDDMFTMTRLDAEYELEFRSVDVYRLVRKVLLETEALALQKRHEVVFDAADDRPLIHADSNYLRRALINIIGNAIKYTPEGGTINVRIDRNERYVIIAVQDNGIGIDDHDLEHIFERFYRADKARGSEGGTGLGLAITRKIIEAHNGCITVESEATRGSTFTLHLPLAEQVESTEK